MSIGSLLLHRWQPVAEKIQENAKSRTPNCSLRSGNGTGHRTRYRVGCLRPSVRSAHQRAARCQYQTKAKGLGTDCCASDCSAAGTRPVDILGIPRSGRCFAQRSRSRGSKCATEILGREKSSRNMTWRTRKSCHSCWPPLLLLLFLAMYRTCKLSKIRQPIIEWRTPMRRNKP